MAFLRDRSIGFTISTAFAASLFLMAVLVGLTLNEIEDVRHERQILTEDVLPTINLAVDVEYKASRLSAQLFLWIRSSSPEDRKKLVEQHAGLGEDLRKLGTQRRSGDEVGQIEALRGAAQALWTAVAKGIDQKDAFGSAIADLYYRGNIPQLVAPTVEAAQRLLDMKGERVKEIRLRLLRRGDHLAFYLLIGFIGAALVCILVARGTIATVTQPARRLVVAARILEHGEYARAIDLGMRESAAAAESDNEIERLRRSFVRMARALQEREERLLEQARHLESTNSRLAALQSITDVALSHLSLDDLLGQLVERLVAATSARSGAILLLDEDRRLIVRAVHGMTPEAVQHFIQVQAGDWVAWLGSTSPPTVRRLGVTTSLAADPSGKVGSQGALWALPLLVTGSALGLAYVESPRDDAFGEETLALMGVFAERVSRAIERARAFAALEDWNETLARRVAEQQEKLIRSERLASIGLVGAGIAHELRNPLGIINNSVYLLRQRLRDADEKAARYTEIIGREVAHAARVIDSLVQFSQHSAPEAHPVDLPRVYEATLARLQLPDEIRVSIEVADGMPHALADEQRLGQVLENLVRNAAQAMEGRGDIHCLARYGEDRVIFQVQDTGPGIPPEHRERIFEPLFSTKPAGMGLGLALCRKMIEAWGGDISVDCPAEGGTIFSIRLRAAKCTTPVGVAV